MGLVNALDWWDKRCSEKHLEKKRRSPAAVRLSRLKNFLAKGYFPKELPPPFRTSLFAKVIDKHAATLPKEFEDRKISSKTISYNLARVGLLRRELGIPNPISYYQLAKETADSWKDFAALYAKTKFALSQPRIQSGGRRTLRGKCDQSDLPRFRARTRVAGRYLLVADIARCYPSIYTHSVPWALHSKKVAKADTSDKLLGNRLDRILRSGQDRQTVGVPIGPDCSYAISELVLTGVDQMLPPALFAHGHRYIDDYEFSFRSLADAESALGFLQQALAEYELELNAQKTHIVELPQPMEDLWASELRLFDIDAISVRPPDYRVMRYFDRAYELASANRDAYVLTYAVARLRNITFDRSTWRVLQYLLLQSAVAEPSTLNRVSAELLKYEAAGYSINKMKLSQALHQIIERHSAMGHHSEIAWALWVHILFGLKVDKNAATLVAREANSVVALLALHARELGLFPKSVSRSTWQAALTRDDLCGPQWLLAYEAVRRRWLKPSSNYIGADARYRFLKMHKVFFYDKKSPARVRKITKELKKPVLFIHPYLETDDF